jgi:hypothetical protein
VRPLNRREGSARLPEPRPREPSRSARTMMLTLLRIEGVVVAHIYPCIGILTHDLSALREPAVEYFPSFW